MILHDQHSCLNRQHFLFTARHRIFKLRLPMIKHFIGRSPMSNTRSLVTKHKSPTGSGRDAIKPYVDGLHPPRLASGEYIRDKQVDESDICELPGWGENQFLAWQGSRSSLNGFSSSLDLEEKRTLNNFSEGLLSCSC